ncbi:MAG: hypothetical protein EOP45_03155 [Sphingobacteriaceae bacterium]|nr:MAG: hypothetical protein EOP45_03155 [Sphingobacteriaceae bacterium]
MKVLQIDFEVLATHAQITLKTDSVYLDGSVRNFAKHKDSANAVIFIINDIALGTQVTYRAKIKVMVVTVPALLKPVPRIS